MTEDPDEIFLVAGEMEGFVCDVAHATEDMVKDAGVGPAWRLPWR